MNQIALYIATYMSLQIILLASTNASKSTYSSMVKIMSLDSTDS